MKPLKLYADIKDGAFEFLSPEYAARSFNALPDGHYTFLIEKYYNKRSLAQNAYLHGVVIPLVFDGLRAAGFSEVKDVTDAKKVIKSLFLKKKIINEQTGELITEIIRDTHELTTVEMNQFFEDVAMWASSYLGITIPEPASQSKLFAV